MKTIVLHKTSIIFLLFMCFLSQVWAQSSADVTITTPNAAEIGRFGAVPVGLFTGSMQYEVPIYELGNANLKLPISLQYSSNGFVVGKTASSVGYDWHLDAGGVINHQINGRPDNYSGCDIDYYTYSFLLGDKTDEQKYYFLKGYNPPDIYTFTLPGHSGSFYIDYDGNPVMIKKDNNLSITFEGSPNYRFIITTSDGVQYIFADYVQPTVPPSEPHEGIELLHSSDSWYLSSIKHPSGDHIDFTYSEVQFFKSWYLNREVYFPINITDTENLLGVGNSTELMQYMPGADRYLERIDFEGVGSVEFTNSYNRRDCKDQPKIDKITVLDQDGEAFREFRLNYLFPEANSEYGINFRNENHGYRPGYTDYKFRMFLNTVKTFDKEGNAIYSYDFDYNDINNLPPRESYSQDQWGYFNGKDNTDFFNPGDYLWLSDRFSSNQYSSLVNVMTENRGLGSIKSDMSADPTFSQKGMLSRINYPTGGYTKIEYEGHKNEKGEEVGGCRVKRIKSYAHALVGSPEVKVYNYPDVITNYSVRFRSSPEATLHHYPYTDNCLRPCFYQNNKSAYFLKLTPGLQAQYNSGGYHICYRQVEVLHGENRENGSEEHEFWAAPQTSSISVGAHPPVITPRKMTNTDLFNGTPTRIAFKKDGVTQKETIYNYDFDNTRYREEIIGNTFAYQQNAVRLVDPFKLSICSKECSACICECDVCTHLPPEKTLPFYHISQYTLISNFPYLESKTETITDDNSNTIVTETFYEYCNAPYTNVRSATVKDSKGREVTTEYKYPFDNPLLSPYDKMVTNKVTAPIIETQEYVVENGQPLLKSTVSTDYTEIGPGFYRPAAIYQLENSKLLKPGSYATYPNGLITRGTNLKLAKQIGYDTRGNVIKVLSKDGIQTNFIWGYGGMYPIVKIVNALPTEFAYTGFESEETKGGWSFSYLDQAPASCLESCETMCSHASDGCQSYCESVCNGIPECINSCTTDCISGSYGQCYGSCSNACKNAINIDTKTGKTGARSFKGYQISKSGLPNGYYRIGYWVRKSGTSNGSVIINGSSTVISNSNWEYRQFTTTSAVESLTINMSGVYLDDLWLCPKDAQITTYTYTPLVGMTSATDDNGISTFYEYDSFGRLKLVKDNQGKILNQYQYHYQGQ